MVSAQSPGHDVLLQAQSIGEMSVARFSRPRSVLLTQTGMLLITVEGRVLIRTSFPQPQCPVQYFIVRRFGGGNGWISRICTGLDLRACS